MRRRLMIVLLLAVPALAGTGSRPLAELAARGAWRRVLEVARLRARQLPLARGEALAAAEAARRVGAPARERRRYLEQAVGTDGPGQVAALELGRAVVTESPDRALALATAVLRDPVGRKVRVAAARLAGEAVERGAVVRDRRGFLRLARRQPRSLRRRLELALAAHHRDALVRLLTADTQDAVAYRAARLLAAAPARRVEERWLVGQALYRHGLYAEAARELGEVERAGAGRPRWKVAFLLGRCAFRQERWRDAERWYRIALGRAHRRSRKAELEAHLARTLELAGRPGEALVWARRAVRHRRSDDRLLLQARLALAAGRRREADRALKRCRRRGARDRGAVLRALEALRRNAVEEALALLRSVRGRSWRGPALVTAASLEAGRGRPPRALELLERAARERLNPFWERTARQVAGGLPPELLAEWRRRAGPAAAPGPEALAAWALLEPDQELLNGLRRHVALRLGAAEPRPRGLAGSLWRLGLQSMAARWDPRGFPRTTVEEAAAAARVLGRLGEAGEAMAAADDLRRRLGPHTPVAMLPRELARALYPLPEAAACRAEAARAGIPWWLLAAVVREESRWEPRALSAVGARGLVQLMPETAAHLARSLGEPVPSADDLFDPRLALHLGAAELARLAGALGERPPVVAAAYNAGEAQTRLWLAACPEPCTDPLFVLTVGFGSTRAYAADVAAAAGWYRELYGSGSAAQAR